MIRLTAVIPRSGTYTELLGPNFRTQCFHTTAPARVFPQFESYQHFLCRQPQMMLLSLVLSLALGTTPEYCSIALLHDQDVEPGISRLLRIGSRWCEIAVAVAVGPRFGIMITCQQCC